MKHSDFEILHHGAVTPVTAPCHELNINGKDGILVDCQVDKEGIRFNQACKILRDQYFSLRHIWTSYGNMDRRFFERQSLAQSIRYSLRTTYQCKIIIRPHVQTSSRNRICKSIKTLWHRTRRNTLSRS